MKFIELDIEPFEGHPKKVMVPLHNISCIVGVNGRCHITMTNDTVFYPVQSYEEIQNCLELVSLSDVTL